MAKSYASLNFDGPMRVDANHAGNPQYVPNSFVSKFRPDTAEAPYKVSDNIVSRKSHYYHEGNPLSEYDQPRDLYENVMDDRARHNLHENTAVMLSHVSEQIIQVRYLAQIYKIKPSYARAVYDGLAEKKFGFEEVEKTSEGIERMGHAETFRPSQAAERLVGLRRWGSTMLCRVGIRWCCLLWYSRTRMGSAPYHTCLGRVARISGRLTIN